MNLEQNNIKKTLHPKHIFPNDKRCCCGKLLAKQTDTGIVIRCARCKQEMVIELSLVSKRYAPV